LRNDPGGLLNGAVGVSAAFLPRGVPVVSTDGRTEDAKRKFIAAPEDYLRGNREDYLKNLPAAVKTVPMVVLVNGGSPPRPKSSRAPCKTTSARRCWARRHSARARCRRSCRWATIPRSN